VADGEHVISAQAAGIGDSLRQALTVLMRRLSEQPIVRTKKRTAPMPTDPIMTGPDRYSDCRGHCHFGTHRRYPKEVVSPSDGNLLQYVGVVLGVLLNSYEMI
jgi:hypothetical protein